MSVHRIVFYRVRLLFSVQEKGVKGASVLCSHKHFDLSTGMVIDVMHCVFLGIMARLLMKFWFDVSHHSSPFSIRRKVFKYVLNKWHMILCSFYNHS